MHTSTLSRTSVPPISVSPELKRRLVGGKWMRCGYTTGTCAAGAAKAAALMLLTGQEVPSVIVETPSGTFLTLDIEDPHANASFASCAVRKQAGDDPDSTDGALIYATVERWKPDEIFIDGGEGIGRVTKPGLDQPVGAAAINSVPRRMIRSAVEEAVRESGGDICDAAWEAEPNRGGRDGQGWRIIVSCPTGEQIARKTFNPKLGIEGGISILGTTGIVEPMSNAALVETMAREISVLAAAGVKDLLVVIGNFGEAFARNHLALIADGDSSVSPCQSTYGVVKSSNFIGDAIAQAAEYGFERVLVLGHLGKLVKAGIGVLNTHSSQGDGRMETLIACALRAGADIETLRDLDDCVSTDAAVVILSAAGLLQETMVYLSERIQETFDRHTPAEMEVEWICFTRLIGDFIPIAESPGSRELTRKWREA